MAITPNPVVEWIGPSRAFTRSDLARMPDDGHRYEVVDGVLVVTPAPSEDHQDAVIGLAVRLREACPEHLKVLVAPFAVVLAEDTELQPDVLVLPRSPTARRFLDGPPLLAVEVLSPSTRHLDLSFKRTRLEAAGCPSFWVVDPSGPSIVGWDLVDGAYLEVARAVGDEPFVAERPFPVRVVPAELGG